MFHLIKSKTICSILSICTLILFTTTPAHSTQIGSYNVTKADLRYIMKTVTESNDFRNKIKQIIRDNPRNESKREVLKLAKYYGTKLQDALTQFAKSNNIDLILTEENISQIKSGHKPAKEEMAYFSEKNGKEALAFLMSAQGKTSLSNSHIENVSDQVTYQLDNTNATHIAMDSGHDGELTKLNAWVGVDLLNKPAGHKDNVWDDIPALKKRVVALLKPEWRDYFESKLKNRLRYGVEKFDDVVDMVFSTEGDEILDRFQNLIDPNIVTRRLEVFVNIVEDKICIDWENHHDDITRFWHCEGKDLLYLGPAKIGERYYMGKEHYEKYKDK